MKTIIANLKLYLPNRYFWIVYLFLITILLVMVGVVATNKDNKVIMVGLFMNLPLIAGFLTTLMQIDIFSKPVSFCLPGHRQSVKNVLLIISIIASIILAFTAALLIFGNQLSTMIIPFFFMNFIFFLLGVELILLTKKTLIIIWFIMFVPSFYIRPYEILGEFIMNHPIITISFGLLICIIIWLKLNFSEIHRKACTIPQLPIDSMWNREKIEKYQQSKFATQNIKIKGEIKPSIERYFLNKMKNYKHFAMGRYIWGNLYKTYGIMFSNFNLLSFSFIYVLILIFCYFNFSSSFILFMFVLMFSVYIQIPVYSTMLISDGRKERYYSAISLSIAQTLFILLFCGSIIVLTNIVKPLMPDIDYSGHKLSFNAVSISVNLLPIIMVPFVLSLRLLFHKRLSLMLITIAVLYALFVVFLIVSEKIFNIKVQEIPSLIINPMSVISIIIALWAFFLAILKRVCFRRSCI